MQISIYYPTKNLNILSNNTVGECDQMLDISIAIALPWYLVWGQGYLCTMHFGSPVIDLFRRPIKRSISEIIDLELTNQIAILILLQQMYLL